MIHLSLFSSCSQFHFTMSFRALVSSFHEISIEIGSFSYVCMLISNSLMYVQVIITGLHLDFIILFEHLNVIDIIQS